VKTVAVDITGQRFGRLTGVAYAGPSPDGRGAMWQFSCACGGSRTARASSVRHGDVTGCGMCRTPRRGGRKRPKRVFPPERGIWHGMKSRCERKSDKSFPDYGGRGIYVCDRWRASFATFCSDMGPRPSPKHSIDRIDNDGPYSPENCRWATSKEQARNARFNRHLVHDGVTRCVSEWAEILSMKAKTIFGRLRDGWSADRALSTPTRERARRAA
jgi:hypothetical protein